MNMTPHSNTAADEVLKGVGTRRSEVSGSVAGSTQPLVE
jgi:hypothetical protein